MSLAAIGQFVVAIGIGGVIVAVINNFLSPKTRAETRSIAQGSAREEINQSLGTLRADVKDARERADRADKRADAAEKRADEADAKYDAVMAQNRVLIELLWRMNTWTKRYYEAGHPPGMAPPPAMPADIPKT